MAAPPGLGFIVPPSHLGLFGDHVEKTLKLVHGLPQQSCILALSRLAQILHSEGEAKEQTQIAAMDAFLRGKLKRRAKSFLVRDGLLFFTYEGITRLSYVVLHACERQDRPMSADEQARLMRALCHVTAISLDDGGDSAGSTMQRAALAMFLSANAPAIGAPELDLFQKWSYYSRIRWHFRRDTSRRTNKLRALVAEQTGAPPMDWHAVAQHWTQLLSYFPEARSQTRNEYGDLFRLHDMTQARHRLGPLMARFAWLNMAFGVGLPGVSAATIRSPRASWHSKVAWRPFYVVHNAVACWDIRILHQMAGPYFPNSLRSALDTKTFGMLSDAWNDAVELAAKDVVSAYNPTAQDAPPNTGGQKADWVIIAERDVFVVEFKNTAPPHSTFREPNVDFYEHWIAERFCKDEGFPQVVATIEKLASTGIADTDLHSFDRVWPIVVTTTPMGHFPAGQRLVESLLHERLQRLREEVPVAKPLLIGFWDFIRLMATGTAAEPGDALRHYLGDKNSHYWMISPYLDDSYGRMDRQPLAAVGDASMSELLDAIQALESPLT